MREEQRMILRMLEEGKLTATEAEGLLRALGEGVGNLETEEEPREDPWIRLEKMGEDFASKVEIATERFARSLEQSVGDKLSKLPKVLARMPFFGYEESQEFQSVFRGPVGPGEVLPVHISSTHGPIHVEGWSEDGYQLTVVQRLRGNDRELLSTRLFDIGWTDGAEKAEFKLAVPNLSDVSISLHLLVPKERLSVNRVDFSILLKYNIQEVHGWTANESRYKHIIGVIVDLKRFSHLIDVTIFHDHNTVTHSHSFCLVMRYIDDGRLETVMQFT